MIVIDFFRILRNKVLGLNTIQAKLDLLESELVSISTSLEVLTVSLENSETIPTKKLSNDAVFQEIILNRTISDSLNQIYNEFNSIKKIAFLVHDPMMLVHYGDVWKAMGATNFTIVLTEYFASDANGNERLGLSDFFTHINTMGYEVKKIVDIISCGIKFEYVVSNHVISGSTEDIKQESEEDIFKKLLNRGLFLNDQDLAWTYEVDVDTYLPLQIGKKQIRYMYGADISDGWSLANWNNIYDVFLCHGVNDEKEIQKRFDGKIFIMGYPRYDRFFSEEIDYANIKHEFGISESKKTLLWMPTLGGDYSSIPLFAEPLSTLSEKFNIIVRPHPLSFLQEKEFIALLEKFNFNIDRNALRDMNELFGVADVILADNGGTPFSCIFLGKNIIFLGVPDNLGPESAASVYLAGSSVEELKTHLPVLLNNEVALLENMLNSEEFYKENNKHIDTLFKKFFDSPRGGGAKRVADTLNSL